jgi:hypothetical protein
MKNFRIAERNTVSLRAEFFNIANHPQFSCPTLTPISPEGRRSARLCLLTSGRFSSV